MSQALHAGRGRPSRYWAAAVLGLAVVLAVGITSVASFALGPVPAQASLGGLPAVGFIVAATVLAIRGFGDREPRARRRALSWAGALLALAVFCWLLVLDVYTFTLAAGPGAAIASALACIPTTGFALLVIRRLDANEKEPWRLVLVAVAWGAIVSTSTVVWAEALWDAFLAPRLVPGPAQDASIAYSAGALEELSKGTALVLLYLVMREEFDNVVDGIVYGAAVGLGFNFMESITYMTHMYAVFEPEGQGAAAATAQWYLRQVLGLFFGHATYTALIGAGVGLARQLRPLRHRLLAIACGFLVAIAGHFAWDAWAQFFPVSESPYALIEMHLRTLFMSGPFTAVVLLLLAMGLEVEGNALSRQFRAEVDTGGGGVLPAELPVLVSPWRRLGARLNALIARGPGAYLRLSRLQAAQIELALERWHRERDEVDEPPAGEEELRRRVLELRADFERPR